jgi:hypothetical protein
MKVSISRAVVDRTQVSEPEAPSAGILVSRCIGPKDLPTTQPAQQTDTFPKKGAG